MRDPRLAEMAFLGELERPEADRDIRMPGRDVKSIYGLSIWEFSEMFVHLVWNGYLNDLGEMIDEHQYRQVVDPANHYATILADKRRELLRCFFDRQRTYVKLNHKGRLRLWQLRSEVESQRGLDQQTGLFRREHFYDDLEIAFSFSRVPVTVLLCDLDHFKSVNDTCGHMVGDQAISVFATALLAQTRKIGTAYRWGGDEFLALLPEVEEHTGCCFAENFRKNVEEEFLTMSGLAKLAQRPTTTIAVATLRIRTASEVVFKQLDDALRSAKKSGERNKVHRV